MTKELFILDHYGLMPQHKQLAEEHYELTEACIVAETSSKNTGDITNAMRSAITEELADVFVLMSQIRQYFGIEQADITNVYAKKVERQLQRIENEPKQ